MIKVGTLAKIRRLHLRDGVPIKEIERRTGMARNTIKTWLRKGQMVEPKYPPRVIVTKLDGYTEQLATWLKADTHRGKCDRRTVKLMYEELAAQGYRGGYGRVGRASKEIAFELGLSSKTVDVHRARLMDRLNLNDVASLTLYAVRKGLIKPGG